MEFNVLEIKQGKVKEKEINFTYKLDNNDINDERVNILSDLDINGKVYYADGGVFRFEATMSCTCEFVCDRCGNTFTSDYEADFYEEYKADVDDDDEDYFPMKNDMIDLSKGILKNFLLNIPIKILCSEDCEGISYDSEKIYEENLDETKKSSPFDALKDLKF
ncbi:MAG: YceD family protein [Clostridia bacterium]|nr:YceD family protein [Clostridia bacterium]